jgi:hypothetical protein
MENRFRIWSSTLNIDTKDFKWRTSINVGINRNEVLELPGLHLVLMEKIYCRTNQKLKVHL